MSRFNTVLRSICTVVAVSAMVQVAVAQSSRSVLNFAGAVSRDDGSASLSVTNTSSHFADAQFTFYNADGTLGAGPINPVSYHIPPRGQIVMRPDEIFGVGKRQGWVQATSSASGLQGFYFVGDFKGTLQGSESGTPLAEQIIPFVRSDPFGAVNIVVANPGPQKTAGTAILYNIRGDEIGSVPLSLAPHAQTFIPVPLPGASGRVSVSAPVLATAVIERSSVLLVSGQAVQVSATRVIPHFTSGIGLESTLVLTNPTNSPVTANVQLFNAAADGSPAVLMASVPLVVPANGSVTRDSRELTASPVTPQVNGWLRIDAAAALNGMVIVDSGSGMTNVPMQSAPSDHLLFSRTADGEDLYSQLALIPATESAANLTITLSRADGATLDQTTTSISPHTKRLVGVRALFPGAADFGSFLTIRSSVPLYALEVIGALSGRLLATVAPQPLGATFLPASLSPRIVRVFPGTDVHPGAQLQVSVANAGDNIAFAFGAVAVNSTQSPIGARFAVDVPKIEPGFVNFKLLVNGIETDSMPLRVLDSEGLLTKTVQGRAFYQKVAVTDDGLIAGQTVMVPIRNARVEVVDRLSQALISVSETDANGRFKASASSDGNVTIRVLSLLRTLDLRVVDNTNANVLYTIFADVDMREPPVDLVLFDTDRRSGAFNILEAIERGNDLIKQADPRTVPPPFTVFWSVRNTNRTGSVANGFVGGTFFNLAANSAYILGDRTTDSDEFDDAVILHEYAHMLAAKFSRDDSPGHVHGLGDLLDPRVAWSEGWANFFSSAARNDSIYRDSHGPNGVNVLRYNLEENVPAGDRPGYWSEASVGSLLWDLFHDTPDEEDPAVQFDFAKIWAAFTDMRGDYFVYLPYFLDHFLARNPDSADVVSMVTQSRSIVFLPAQAPSVANPFPRPLTTGQSVTGQIDSLTTKRTNLVTSSHFFGFTTSGGATAVRLDITGLGPGNNPSANDLDLYLLDLNGRVINKSNAGLNGQAELVSQRNLAAGTYVIEVRSYYTLGGAETVVYNSGDYRLILLTQ